MSGHRNTRCKAAFTLPELLVIVVAIGVLAVLMMASVAHERERSNRIKCVGNLKSAALSLKIFAADHLDRYPYQIRPPLTAETSQATTALNAQ